MGLLIYDTAAACMADLHKTKLLLLIVTTVLLSNRVRQLSVQSSVHQRTIACIAVIVTQGKCGLSCLQVAAVALTIPLTLLAAAPSGNRKLHTAG